MSKVKRLKTRRRIRKFVSGLWYTCMSPVAKLIQVVEDGRRDQFEESLTEDRAVEYVVDELVRYLVRYPKDGTILLSAEHYGEDFANVIDIRTLYRILRSSKAKTSFFKFKGKSFYDIVLEGLRNVEGVELEDCRSEFESRHYVSGLRWAYTIKLND